MRLCVIGNLTDRRCGIQNFCQQTITAFRHGGFDVVPFDGTYAQVYARQQEIQHHPEIDPFWPPDLESYDVVHFIWHALTINHYTGANWARFDAAPGVKSFWDCGPSDAYCPFDAHFPIKWMLYKDHRDGYHLLDYPVPDWIDDLPPVDPGFVVGASGVRGDGIEELTDVCTRHDWTMNLPTPGQWTSIEDEIRRLARSTVNVCWYNQNALWKDRASAPSMLIAARRPVLISDADLVKHLWDQPDIYHGQLWLADGRRGLEPALTEIYREWRCGPLFRPLACFDRLRWQTALPRFLSVWQSQGASR